ncbi:uncharacterized protein LOC124171488 [Ischnura elegans]|uniref:uncharacterized protein LOC124171488 n=1 Tax=Ischnura elegans TaxID=197161 RepID=UPI001ED89CAF|nr:uncharacterized protein LOC124171488 [Ischnura elegans]
MVVPVPGGADRGRSPDPGRPAKDSLKPKIISELMKKGCDASTPPRCGRPVALDSPAAAESPEAYGDRPKMSGVLHCARSEWSPRWEPRYVRVNHGSLEVYLTEEGAQGWSTPYATSSRPRRRLPLRNLSLRRVPRRQHAFAICPREANASPLLLCQADDEESFSRWTRTLAVELMRQTPLGEVRFLDILRITEPPHPDDVDEQHGFNGQPFPEERLSDEVERLKELCQRGTATVHERRQLFEALGGAGSNGTLEPRKNLTSSRPCASSEDLGQQIPCKSVARSRAKRAKSLHDLPSDFPVPCALEGGPPISVVSQLRLFFERIGTKSEESGDCSREEGRSPDSKAGQSVAGHTRWAPDATGQTKKTARSQSYTCESTHYLVKGCCATRERENVLLSASNQKLGLGKDSVQDGGKDLTSENHSLPDILSLSNKHYDLKDVNMNSYSKNGSCYGKHDGGVCETLKRTENITQAGNVAVSNNSQPPSLSHSLSSESLTSSHLPSVPSPSSSCSSLSLNYSTPSTSPHSHLSQHHYILSVIKKQAAEVEETIWSLQEEMAKLDRERIAAQNDEKKITRKSSTPKKTYSELEAQLQQEELKLDKLYKEAERVLRLIERSVKQENVLVSMDQYQMDKKWGDLNASQKFNLRTLTSQH